MTNAYPQPHARTSGTFVEQQVTGLRRIGVDVDVFYVPRLERGRSAYRGVGHRVRSAVVESGIDVVHVMYGGVMADRVTRRAGVPTVVSFCGSDLLGEPFPDWVRRLSVALGVAASHRAARRADGVIVKSEGLRQALPSRLEPGKVRLVPNGVDLDRFRPIARPQAQDRLGWDPKCFHVLLACGSASPVKRPELARDAVGELGRYGVRAELHLMSGVSHDQVPVWLNASNAVLLTSLHEGSPNIVKEALACNVPVVAVDVGDVAARVVDVAGTHIAQAEPADLAAKLLLVEKAGGRVAGRSAVVDLSIERVAADILAIYQEVLWNSRSRTILR